MKLVLDEIVQAISSLRVSETSYAKPSVGNVRVIVAQFRVHVVLRDRRTVTRRASHSFSDKCICTDECVCRGDNE